MGGRALKNTFTRRYTKEEFDSVSKELVETLELTFNRAATPLFYHNKETFGDIDIIVDMGDKRNRGDVQYGGAFVRTYIEKTFKPNEIFHNGNCYSFDYKEVQVDFMCVPSEDYDSNYHYLAFNDLGNYIGRIAHRLGLKYGQEGLWYNHYLRGQNLGKVMISKDYREIFEFLDLDYSRWLEGFDELEDTFKFVTTSKYFDTDMFQLDSLNRINRERNIKRASYMSFLDWINTEYDYTEGDKLEGNIEKYIEKAFPESNFKLKLRNIEYKEAKKALANAKFNGSMVMNKYGLEGKEIGMALKDFKHSLEADGYVFEDYLIYESQENIFREFESLLEV